MADLSLTQVPVATGALLSAALVAADVAGDTAPTGANRVLYVQNADASQHTVTITTPGQVSGLDVADFTLAIPAGDEAIIPLGRVFAGSQGRAAISYSSVTGMSVAVFALEFA